MTDPYGDGEAVVQKNYETGEVTVLYASDIIRVAREVLAQLDRQHFDGQTLVLDSTREYQYRYLRDDPDRPGVLLYRRI